MKEFLENFWYYNKWKLFFALIVLLVVINTISTVRDNDKPDYFISVVTLSEFPEELCNSITELFSSALPDKDGDGETVVKLNLYRYGMNEDITPYTLTEDDAIHLAADIQVGESCLFISDETEVFEEAELIYGGACSHSKFLSDFSSMLEGFFLYFPTSSDSAFISLFA